MATDRAPSFSIQTLGGAGTPTAVVAVTGRLDASSRILAAVKWTRPHGGGVTPSGANPAIPQLFQIAGLEPLLELVTSSVGVDGIPGA